MKFKILGDSSTDINKEIAKRVDVTLVPLTMEIDGIRYIDDENLDIEEYMKKANESANVPKTSCPSPEDYMRNFEGDADNIFVITISGKLSGSYNAAELGKQLYLEEHPDTNIHVFDSKSASSGEVAIALYIKDCIDEGNTYQEIVDKTEKFIKEMGTIFVLEKIDHLYKAGRMSMLKTSIAKVLNIKLVLTSNDEGEIKLVNQARGVKKALSKMIDSLAEVGKLDENKRLIIAHCQAAKRALDIKLKIEQKYKFKEILIVEMHGLSSNYSNLGGVVIAF